MCRISARGDEGHAECGEMMGMRGRSCVNGSRSTKCIILVAIGGRRGGGPVVEGFIYVFFVFVFFDLMLRMIRCASGCLR